MNIEPLAHRFEAFGWTVSEIDGNDVPTFWCDLRQLPTRRASSRS